MAIQTPRDIQLSEPLEGEDAERLVAYIENPVPPAGHDEYVTRADQAFADVQPRGTATP